MAAAQLTVFKQQLAEELGQYCAQQRQVVQASYGDQSLKAAELLFNEVLHGSHNPGLLVMVGYALEQGSDDQVALTAARAVELLAAAAHLFDAGQAIAGQFGYGQAMTTLANLPGTTEADRVKALSITSHSTVLRAHGVANNRSDGQFALWRDAHFYWLNPIHVGMVLAGADCHGTDDITAYTLALGSGDIPAATALLPDLESRWQAGDLLAQLHDDVSQAC